MSYRLFFLTILLPSLLVSNMSGATEEVQTGRQTECFIRVDTTVNLLIFHPKYRHIDLVCGKMPSKKDTTIIFCAAAAFTGKLLNEFKHSNIVGPHVSNGVHYNGAGSNSNYGLFVATDSV